MVVEKIDGTKLVFSIAIKGDTNGDKEVNVADVVKLVNDHAPQAEIDEVVDIIMKKK